MATNGTPPSTWPVEPTTLYIWLYYPTNGINENPEFTSNLLQTFNDAVEQSKTYITNMGNVGVTVIQPISCTIVYPSIPWQDF